MWASGQFLHWELLRHVFCELLPPPNYVALWDSKTPHRPASERVSYCLEASPPSRLPLWDGSPSLTILSPFLSFIFCLLKRIGCLSGCLMSCASIQELFCGSCSAFKWSFDELVGEKVVSLSYSSAILGPLPGWMDIKISTLNLLSARKPLQT